MSIAPLPTPAPGPLDDGQFERIESALYEALPQGSSVTVDRQSAAVREGDIFVNVSPDLYPEDRYAFFKGVASAEIHLRDAGLPVVLVPRAAQRFLVVALPSRGRPFAFLTTEDSWDDDHIRLLTERSLDSNSRGFSGYVYDSPKDLRMMLGEARAEHPDADFSLVDAAL